MQREIQTVAIQEQLIKLVQETFRKSSSAIESQDANIRFLAN